LEIRTLTSFSQLEIADLKREIETLKTRPIVPPDVAVLQQRLKNAERNIEELEEKCADYYQDKLSLETLINTKTTGDQYAMHPTGSRPLTHNAGSLNAYQKLLKSNQNHIEEIDQLKRRLTQSERDLSGAKAARKLNSAPLNIRLHPANLQ
jgi:multidrug resistance efflux pump